ncbi:MAG TPA: DUF58 domain-containing protein [Caulobacteraceae bacterium]|jgi:uncharacterized protein (DUF58 family)
MSASPPNPEQLLRRLDWTVIRRLEGQLQGDYRTLFRGSGMDLADLREYQLHDDARHIDWNVTARMNTPYVREHHEDREITAWFLLDLSPSMDLGSGERRKRDALIEFTGMLARILTRRGNRVGALFYSGAGLDGVIPVGGGRRHVLRLLHALNARPELKAAKPTDLAQFLRAGFNLLKRRSLVFVVSDFISTPGWDQPLSLLGRRHEVLAVRLVDPIERDLPDLGLFTLQDAETGERLFVDSHDKAFRRRFAKLVDQREAELRDAFGRGGVDVLELAPGDDLAEALMRFSQLRRRRARGGLGASRAMAAAGP